MTALSTDRNTPSRIGEEFSFPVAAAVKIYAGALLVLDAAGNCKPAVTATGLKGIGRAEEQVDNSSGSAADVNVKVRSDVFRWGNSASADEITKAEIGDVCYVVDDQTVAKTDGSSTRSPAGLVVDVDSVGVWVLSGVHDLSAPGGALLAANNLSDVGTAATAFANIKQAATASATGVVELATPAEVRTGTDTGRAVTPEGVAGYAAEKMSDPTFVIGAQAGNDITVNVQLNGADGNALAERGSLRFFLSDDADGDSIAATAPSGGFAKGTDGFLEATTAGKAGWLHSEADGDFDLVVTEAGADTWYLIIVMPDGRYVASEAITFS